MHNEAPSSDERYLGTLSKLWELATLVTDDMAAGLSAQGLTRARGELLMRLLLAGQPLTQRTLADLLQVTPRNITGLVDALEKDGHLHRRPHETDRRATLVELTGQGRAAVQRMFDESRQLAVDLLGELDPAALGAFDSTLDGILGRYRDLAARTQARTTGAS
jgi:DNA-binding MarR family transcriptional regulator